MGFLQASNCCSTSFDQENYSSSSFENIWDTQSYGLFVCQKPTFHYPCFRVHRYGMETMRSELHCSWIRRRPTLDALFSDASYPSNGDLQKPIQPFFP